MEQEGIFHLFQYINIETGGRKKMFNGYNENAEELDRSHSKRNSSHTGG